MAANKVARDLRPYLVRYGVVWLSLPAALVAGVVAHTYWSRSPAALAGGSVLVAFICVGLVAYVWHVSSARDAVTRGMATVSTALGSGWVTLATILGPLQRPVIDIFLWGGIAVCVAHNARRLLRGEGGDHADGWSDLAEKIRLPKSRVVRASVDGPRFEARVALDRGRQTHEDAQSAGKRIASALGVPPSVRVVPDPEDGGTVTVYGVTEDVLRESRMWPGPSSYGGSFADGFRIGIYENGQPVMLHLAGDKATGRAPTHLLAVGMSRAGKTQGVETLAGDAETRRDMVLWLGDSAKGAQSTSAVAAGLDWFARTAGEIKAMIKAAYDIARARSNWLGERGYTDWQQGCGIPALVVWIEEAHEHIADNPVFDALCKQGLSAGVFLIASTQRPSYMSMSTESRSQFGAVWCFGVNNDTDAAFVVPDEVMDAGVSPGQWRNLYPGKSLLVAPGIDPQQWSMPLRSFDLDRDYLRQVVKQAAEVRAELDPVSAQIAGEAYARRGGQSAKAESEGQLEIFDQLEDLPALPDDPGVPVDIDPSAELEAPHPPGMTFAIPQQPVRQLDATQAAKALRQHLADRVATGDTQIGPAALSEFRQSIGRSRTWVSRQLTALADDGVVEETSQPGVYLLRELVPT